MPDIHILRPHALGLADARALAERWVQDAQERHGMTCVHTQGPEHDEVTFKQPGVDGLLTVTADRFELTAELGFLLRSFTPRITATIESRLDELLNNNTPPPSPHKL
ncbi:MAG: polyhydroxyalkanoic acid system family protein [Pseudomonadota bacterium]